MASENIQVELTNVRLSFPALFKPKKVSKEEDAPKKHSGAFLMDKKTKEGKANIKKVERAIADAIAEKWPKKAPKFKSDKICLRDGDDEDYAGYEGNMYVSASSNDMPTLVDRRGKLLKQDTGMLYGGCYVNAFISIWAQDNDYGRRINAQLDGVQFVSDGESFGGHTPLSADKFKNLDGDDDDYDDEEEDEDEDEDEDDRPSKKSKSKKSKSKSRDEDEEEDEEEEDERPSKKSKGKKDSKKSKKSRDEDEEEDEDEDEDERPSKKSKSKKSKKSSKKSRHDDDDDDDDEYL